MLKMTIFTSVWGVQHPNTSQNIQQVACFKVKFMEHNLRCLLIFCFLVRLCNGELEGGKGKLPIGVKVSQTYLKKYILAIKYFKIVNNNNMYA